ncbi:MAG: rRNA maturation RNase YbeY [Anaerolineales bacterium]
MIHLQIDELFSASIDLAQIKYAAEIALHHQSVPSDAALTIIITGDDQIQELNQRFLGIASPTDVLSFPSGEKDPDSNAVYLGDIIISFPRAQAQSRQGGHAVKSELQLLTVHGVLHLLGYDHATADEKRRMWSAQTEILAKIDCPHSPCIPLSVLKPSPSDTPFPAGGMSSEPSATPGYMPSLALSSSPFLFGCGSHSGTGR